MTTHTEAAARFKALSDATRLRILGMLPAEGELCACEILEALDITQPTLSYHMKLLAAAGLVLARRDGIWMRYRLNGPALSDLRWYLDDLSADRVGTDRCGC